MNYEAVEIAIRAVRCGATAIGVCLSCKLMRRLSVIHTWLTTRGALCGVCKGCEPALNGPKRRA